MNLSPRAQELLALQQVKYLRSLPDKKARLEKALNAIKQQGWKPNLEEALKMEVHRLSGSAGSYGLSSLGKAAQRLDLMLSDSSNFKTPGRGLNADFLRLMGEMFVALEENIEGSSENPDLKPKH